MPHDSRESSCCSVCSDRTAHILLIQARIPGRESVAGGIYPRAEVFQTHAVIQGQPPGNLPRIGSIERRGEETERGNDVEILFRVIRGLADEHIGVRIAAGLRTPVAVHGRAVYGSVARLLVPGALPVEAELCGM